MTVYKFELKKDIKIFRFPHWIGMILLYVSYALVNVFDFRSGLIGTGLGMQGLFGVIQSDKMSITMSAAIFLTAGIIDYIMFEALAWLFSFYMRTRFPHLNSSNMRHVLRIFFIGRNLVLAPLYTVLFFYPLSIVWVTSVVKFAVSAIFALGFYFYFVNRNMPVFMHGRALMMMGQVFLIYNLLLAVMMFFG